MRSTKFDVFSFQGSLFSHVTSTKILEPLVFNKLKQTEGRGCFQASLKFKARVMTKKVMSKGLDSSVLQLPSVLQPLLKI